MVGGTTFHSEFNTGHGMQTFTDGKATGGQWTDIAQQSILPSWQWWIDTSGKRPTVDFDYGSTEQRWDTKGAPIKPDYVPQGGYRGGSSLVVHGDLTGQTGLRLFKTDLSVQSGSQLSLTYKKVSGDDKAFSVRLYLASDPSTPIDVEVPGSGATSQGWTTVSLDLAKVAGGKLIGQKIATIALALPESQDYQVNLGAVSVSADQQAPSAPTDVSLRQVFSDGQAVLAWKRAEFSQVDGYQVEAVDAKGATHSLGGGFTSLLYLKDVPNTGAVRFQVRAIGKNGVLSEPTSVNFDFGAQVQDLKTSTAASPSGLLQQAPEAGKVDVTWTGSAKGRCRVDVRLVHVATGAIEDQPYGTTVDCDAKQASVPVPVREGFTFDATVTPEGQRLGVSLRGRTHDGLAAPLAASNFTLDGQNLVVHTPLTADWWKIDVSFVDQAGTSTQMITGVKRGDSNNRGLQRSRALPAKDGTLKVHLTDYAGNTTDQSFTVTGGKFAADEQGPTFTLEGRATQQVTKGSPITPVTVTATDPAAPVRLELDGPVPDGLQVRGTMGEPASPGLVISGTPSELGDHTITVKATDAFGNTSSQQVKITVQKATEPPVEHRPLMVSAAPQTAVGRESNVWGSVDGPATVRTQVLLGGTWSTSQERQATGYFVVPLTYGRTSAGTLTWRVQASYADGTVVTSAPFTQARRNPPSASNAGNVPAGRTTYVWGMVDHQPGVPVWTEVWVNGHWSRSQSGTTNASGGYTLPLTYGASTKGSYLWRVSASYPSIGTLSSTPFTLVRS